MLSGLSFEGLYPKLYILKSFIDFLSIELISAIFELMVFIIFGSESDSICIISLSNWLLITLLKFESVLLYELSFYFYLKETDELLD